MSFLMETLNCRRQTGVICKSILTNQLFYKTLHYIIWGNFYEQSSTYVVVFLLFFKEFYK